MCSDLKFFLRGRTNRLERIRALDIMLSACHSKGMTQVKAVGIIEALVNEDSFLPNDKESENPNSSEKLPGNDLVGSSAGNDFGDFRRIVVRRIRPCLWWQSIRQNTGPASPVGEVQLGLVGFSFNGFGQSMSPFLGM